MSTRAEKNTAEVIEQLKDLNSRVLTKSELTVIIDEVRDGLKLVVEQAVEGLRAEFKDVLKEKDCVISNLSDQVVKKSKELDRLTDKLAVAENAIKAIKVSQNRSEQYTRRHSLRLHNVPRKNGETAEDCLNIVRKIIHDTPDLDIPDVVLHRAHRVGKASGKRPPAIILKFSIVFRLPKNHWTKGLYYGQIELKSTNRIRLNT